MTKGQSQDKFTQGEQVAWFIRGRDGILRADFLQGRAEDVLLPMYGTNDGSFEVT